jgi:steroid delta-isomerase-like uncharacterized protein
MSEQTLLEAAKASIIAYNNKDWDAVRRVTTAGVVYDEVSTNRRAQGIDNVLPLWQAWAAAFPDSKATFERTHVSGNTVIVELTWRGTQTGTLRTASGDVPATGKTIEIRACQIIDVLDGQTRSVRHYFDMATLMAQLGLGVAGV